MSENNSKRLNDRITPAYGSSVALLLVTMSVGAAYAFAPFANGKPAVAVAAAIFPVALIVLLGLPAFQCLRVGPRILLILLTLRPLVDVSSTFQVADTASVLKSSSGLSLQEGFAALFGLLLVAVWIHERGHSEYKKLPNIFLATLLGLTTISWLMGGFSEGARSFVRTVWGLLVALLLGSLFRAEKQADIFVRAIFYSSIFVLMTLGLNLSSGLTGTETDSLWRLGGQYGTPNALAGVALSFLLYGLYVVGRARSVFGRALALALLSLIGLAIVGTQSRTVGALMLLSVVLSLWASRHRWITYVGIAPVVLFLFASEGIGWRLSSSFSLANKELDPNVLTLQGRILLWAEWYKSYMDASWFHKLFGIGWADMLHNFLRMAFPTSSITESSYLWFLLGTGALGLLAFCAYLVWVLLKSWVAWRRDSGFDRHFALIVFLAAICFAVESFTTDVATSPNAVVYIFAIMSIFVFRRSRVENPDATSQ